MYTAKVLPADFETSGQLVYALVSNLQQEEIKPLLQKYGLAEVNVNQWYRTRDIVALFAEMAQRPNFSNNFVAVGMAAANLLIQILPPEIQAMSLEQILMAEEELIYANYRNPSPGFIRVTKVDDNTYYHDSQTVWPDELNYGFVYSFVRHFCPKAKRFTVRMADDMPGQDDGGEFLRIKIALSSK
ncbi:MAG: hypothetical protein BroJett018_51410 [Chloroflexota bacterium]|nr:MAG: hypothetical protein BroJett018_51410 [Chloroflexota bacterium]